MIFPCIDYGGNNSLLDLAAGASLWMIFSKSSKYLISFPKADFFTEHFFLTVCQNNFGNKIPQNSQQKSVPDLHGVTVAFLALKIGFSEKKSSLQKI